MKIEIWSDVVCPWCYVGKARFEAALARFEHRDHVEVTWRSFELDPTSPRSVEGEYEARLARKYGVPLAEARQMIERMVRSGRETGLDLRFDIARPGNTFDAHRLIHFAGEHGRQAAMTQRLFEATFTEGRAVGDRETLAAVAVEVGLDGDEARGVLESDRYTAAVRDDERQAAVLGISAVPFFVIDRAYGIAGAHPPDAILDVLAEAWQAGPEPARR